MLSGISAAVGGCSLLATAASQLPLWQAARAWLIACFVLVCIGTSSVQQRLDVAASQTTLTHRQRCPTPHHPHLKPGGSTFYATATEKQRLTWFRGDCILGMCF